MTEAGRTTPSVTTPQLSRVRLLALAAAILLAVTACVSSSDVQSLATESTHVANELVGVYTALHQVSEDTLSLRKAAVVLGVSKTVDEQDLQQTEIQLDLRMRLAEAFGGLFQSLTTLATSKTSDTSVTAAGNIGGTIQKLSIFHGGKDPQTALNGVATLFFAWKANQDLTSVLQLTAPALGKVADFYGQEVDTYRLVIGDDADSLSNLREKMIDDGFVAPTDLLPMLTGPYGLQPASPKCQTQATAGSTADPNKCVEELAKALIDVRAFQLKGALNGAVASMGQALRALADAYQSLPRGGSAHVDFIKQYVDQTSAYLQEASRLRPLTLPQK